VNQLDLFGAFALGLAGAGHCLGMCGGIASALSMGERNSLGTTLAYHGGRIGSYTLLGALLGFLAGSLHFASWALALRYLAGFLLVAMGLYIGNWWRGLAILERGGAIVWRPIQRLGAKWLPLQHWRQGLALGLCWGLMPCGLIYSSLAWAATAQSPLASATLMLVFGLGTLPAMLATSLGAQHLQMFLRKRGLKLIIALLLILSGLISLYLTASHGVHHGTEAAGEGSPHHHMD
jgi:sulfite exporter TauE/SafE